MNGIELKETERERDLGVIFSSDLKWKNHVMVCESKANAMLGMIRKTFATIDSRLLRTLYVSFVRPLIEFAAPVWSPSLKGYEERLKRLDLTTLEKRRERGDAIQLFKIFNDIEKVKLMTKPIFHNVLRCHDQCYRREICKFSPRQEFLTNRAANNWNALTQTTINSTSTIEFKCNFDKETND
jgi:hypothetical protein